MTQSELKDLLDFGYGIKIDVPATYGNIWVGVWNCPKEGCDCSLVPRELRIALPDGHLPFPCPLCGTILEYDEEG